MNLAEKEIVVVKLGYLTSDFRRVGNMPILYWKG